MDKQLSLNTAIQYNDLELLFEMYIRLADGNQVVSLDSVYQAFKQNWEHESIDFLYSNKEVYELEDVDLLRVPDDLEAYGLVIPSYAEILHYFEVMQLMYVTSKKDVIHSPLVGVW